MKKFTKIWPISSSGIIIRSIPESEYIRQEFDSVKQSTDQI